MRIPPVSLSTKPFTFFNFSVNSLKRFAVLVLAIQLLFIPAPVASAAAIGDAIRDSSAATARKWEHWPSRAVCWSRRVESCSNCISV